MPVDGLVVGTMESERTLTADVCSITGLFDRHVEMETQKQGASETPMGGFFGVYRIRD